jgi:hypothetical protein
MLQIFKFHDLWYLTLAKFGKWTIKRSHLPLMSASASNDCRRYSSSRFSIILVGWVAFRGRLELMAESPRLSSTSLVSLASFPGMCIGLQMAAGENSNWRINAVVAAVWAFSIHLLLIDVYRLLMNYCNIFEKVLCMVDICSIVQVMFSVRNLRPRQT